MQRDPIETAARALCRLWMEKVDDDYYCNPKGHPNWRSFADSLDAAIEAEWKDNVDEARTAIAAYEAAAWCRDMDAAPRDGTKVDLLFPAPRGRTIDCFWDESPIFGPGWFWRTPTWAGGDLLSEGEWQRNCYPNMQPIAWRLPPAMMVEGE